MQTSGKVEPLRSCFAGDADMVELVQEFVQELPGRAQTLAQLMQAAQLDDLRRAAHQLKGAAGGYGFPTISESAGTLEKMLHGGTQNQASELQARVNELVALCNRAVAA